MSKVFLVSLLFLCFALLEAAQVEIKLEHKPSVKSKWIRDGTWNRRVATFRRQHHLKQSKMSLGQAMTNYYDDFYVAQIQLGTPPQTFIVRPDTSYANLWLMDKNTCTSKACTGYPDLLSNYNRTLFNGTASSSFVANKSVNFTASVYYSSLCDSGILGRDEFVIPGFAPVTQWFGLCQVADPYMGFHPYDGILGLGLSSLAQYNLMTPLQNEINSGNFDKPAFSIWINGLIGEKEGGITPNGGQITWGGFDTQNCDSNINYVPLSSMGYWQFTLSGFSLGSYSLVKNQQIITSTGYTEMGMPSNVILSWLPQINGTYDAKSTNYYASCDTSNYPPMVFTIGGVQYSLPPTEFVDDNNNGTCRVRVFNTDGSFGPKWILSTIFIRNYCTHHDVGNSRIGFSKSIHTMM